MKAVVITGIGGPEVLEVREVPTPEPRGDQVRIRVAACGLNRADLMQCRGMYPAPPGAPADIPGLEYAGVVDALGPDVDRAAEAGRPGLRHRRRRRPGRVCLDVTSGWPCRSRAISTSSKRQRSPKRSSPHTMPCSPRAVSRRASASWSTPSAAASGRPPSRSPTRWAASSLGTSRTAAKLDATQGSGIWTTASTPRARILPSVARTQTAEAGVDVVIDLLGGRRLRAIWRHWRRRDGWCWWACSRDAAGARPESHASQAAHDRRHDAPRTAARRKDRGDAAVRRPGRPLAGAGWSARSSIRSSRSKTSGPPRSLLESNEVFGKVVLQL